MFFSVSLSDTLFMVAVSVASQWVAGGTYTMAMTRIDSTLKLSRTRGAGGTHSTMVIYHRSTVVRLVTATGLGTTTAFN